ncbi:MAG: prephenate dehydrogenase [Bacteroidota bacterium]|nr:prephenate dehydrogenase [Bacteroidota bacterium]
MKSSSRHFPQHVAIIGLGVIGGSLGLAIKRYRPEIHVAGFDSPKVMARARKRRAIDSAAGTLKHAVASADIVFLCTPISSILSLLPRVAKFVQPHTVVTDAGSVKGVVQLRAKKIFGAKGIFIGGHPMAGSEGSGIDYADALLFQNAVYVLCPNLPLSPPWRGIKGEDHSAMNVLAALVQSIGARVLVMSAGEHDRVAATISHLPQLLAVALTNLAGRKSKSHPAFLQLAAGGFRDMTRIASSPFPMWNDILRCNRSQIALVLNEMTAQLRAINRDLVRQKSGPMQRRFRSAKLLRDAIPKNSKGFLHPLHDIYVWVDDMPGALAKITTALFRAGINIHDIELLKIREGEAGTFRFSFDSADDAQKAKSALVKNLRLKVQ